MMHIKPLTQAPAVAPVPPRCQWELARFASGSVALSCHWSRSPRGRRRRVALTRSKQNKRMNADLLQEDRWQDPDHTR